MRKPILAANWKMNKTPAQAIAFVEDFLPRLDAMPADREAVLIPTLLALPAVQTAIQGSAVQLGAQDVHPEKKGAYTGEVSAPMLAEAGCHYVVIGHSERRQYFHETNTSCNRKIHAAFAEGLVPIYCIGETLKQRENGVTHPLVEIQVREGLAGLLPEQVGRIVLAYEPVWAIGTGVTATTDQAQQVHASLRAVLAGIFGSDVANQVRIQYGGSVKPENVDELMKMEDIDGALVGGASLDPQSFSRIVLFKD